MLDERVARVLDGCDLAVHAGDVGDVGVLERMRGACEQVIAVRGNNDVPAKVPAASQSVLPALPDSAWVDLPGGRLLVVHGDRVLPAARRHEKLRRAWPGARLVVYGHSHRLCVDRDAVPWVANPGAAGRARTHGGPSLLILDASRTAWAIAPRRFAPAA